MKRRLLIIAICLVLGAVVNVAVAWGCAVLVDPYVVQPEERRAPRWVRVNELLVDWHVWVWTRIGVKHTYSMMGGGRSRSGKPDPTDIMPYWLDFEGPTPEHKASEQFWETRTIDGRGWPAISMWCEQERTYWGLGLEEEYIPLQGGIETGLSDWDGGPWFQSKRVLPLRPIWPGFAINTIFYATLVWLLIVGPFVLRRFLRVRRGLCPKCAYPMGESAVCTECGNALAKQARAT